MTLAAATSLAPVSAPHVHFDAWCEEAATWAQKNSLPIPTFTARRRAGDRPRSFLYFARSKSLIKFGWSKDPWRRVAEFSGIACELAVVIAEASFISESEALTMMRPFATEGACWFSGTGEVSTLVDALVARGLEGRGR